MRIDEALEKFLLQLQADGRSPHTVGQYRRHIRLLAQWAHDVRPSCAEVEGMDHEAVARFLAAPVATGRAGGGAKKATSANCLRSSLKGFFSYLHKAGFITQDPARLIRPAICAPPPPKALPEDDEARLLDVLSRATGPEAERDHILFHLLLRSGIRLGSAIALDLEDVDLERGEVQFRTAKGNRPERVFLGDTIKVHLSKYLAGRPAGALFTASDAQRITCRHAQRRLGQWLRKAGITRSFSPHSLRHRFAMRVYGKTHDLLLTQAALRHRSIASTTVYARADEARLRAVI